MSSMNYRPRPVLISKAVIGQGPRPQTSPKILNNGHSEEPQPLSPGEILPDIAKSPQDTATGDKEVMGEPMTLESEIQESKVQESQIQESEVRAIQLLAATVPLPESDSDDVDAPNFPQTTTQEVLVPLDTECSPTYSDEGIAARVWVSPQIAEWERWMVVKANLKTMELIPRSPYVPRTFSEWLTHRAEMTDIKVKELSRRLEIKEATAKLGPDRPRVVAAFGGNTFEDADNGISRSGFGAEETFWSLWMKPTKARPRADWPCQAEMKEEGDERNTSGFGRFPALPRVTENSTVNYKHQRVLIPTGLDEVWPPPIPSAYQVPTEELDDDYARMLLGKDLAGALDAD